MSVYSHYFDHVAESSDWIQSRISIQPKVMVVLSGGLDSFLDNISNQESFTSSDIPHFPKSNAQGHAGKIIFGEFNSTPMVILQGRYHYYEGHLPQTIVFPYFVMSELGVKTLITTNAVGGINRDFSPGDIMLVRDHINMMGVNPLIGLAVQRKTDQFTSMTDAYSERLAMLAKKCSQDINLPLKEGVYLATSGPCYETKAEIRAFRGMGADAVGMSTVPAVIAANFLNMNVLSLSCIANPAADLHEGKMTHAEVLNTMNAMAEKVVLLLNAVCEKL